MMISKAHRLKILILLLLAAYLTTFQGRAADLLKKVADVALPGGATRFDYQSIDAGANRLYFSHMGDGKLMVFDTKTETLVTNLPGFPAMTGVLVVPALKRVYGSVTRNHEVAVVDTDSLVVVKRIPDGRFPDGLAFSPETKKLYVSSQMNRAALTQLSIRPRTKSFARSLWVARPAIRSTTQPHI